jgi:hypothetical protein
MEKYGFVYLWFDKAYKRFYIGCHWGTEDDGYICSSSWMKKAYNKRPKDFKRRILVSNIPSRQQTFDEEYKFLQRIKPEEVKIRYYNWYVGHNKNHWSATPNAKSIAKKSGDARKGKSLDACSEETRKKISEAKKGKPFSDQHKEALKVSRAKQTFSEESNKKRSESLKKAYAEGKRAPTRKGKPRPKLVRLCLECCAATPSRRALYCLEHRYTAMNKTRANLADSKWANSKA